MNGMSTGLLRYVGLERHKGTATQRLLRDDIAAAAIRKAFGQAKLHVVAAKRAAKETGRLANRMRYTALLCEAT